MSEEARKAVVFKLLDNVKGRDNACCGAQMFLGSGEGERREMLSIARASGSCRCAFSGFPFEWRIRAHSCCAGVTEENFTVKAGAQRVAVGRATFSEQVGCAHSGAGHDLPASTLERDASPSGGNKREASQTTKPKKPRGMESV